MFLTEQKSTKKIDLAVVTEFCVCVQLLIPLAKGLYSSIGLFNRKDIFSQNFKLAHQISFNNFARVA